jgi:hypothetical protein
MRKSSSKTAGCAKYTIKRLPPWVEPTYARHLEETHGAEMDMTKRRTVRGLVLSAMLLAVCTSEALAQYGPPPYGPPPPSAVPIKERPHLYIGIEGQVFLIMKQVTDAAGYLGQGGGGGVIVGYRFGPYIDLEFNLGITYHDQALESVVLLNSLYLLNVMGDIKVHIPMRGRMDPFFQAGVGYGYLGANYADVCGGSFSCDTTFAQGPAFEVGGGFDYWLGPRLTIGARALYRAIRFGAPGSVQNGSSNFINGLSIGVNGTFHFM